MRYMVNYRHFNRGNSKEFFWIQNRPLSPDWSEMYFWDRIWAFWGTLEVPSDFFKLHFFVQFFFSPFFLVDMPLRRGGARASQKVTVLSQNSTPFGPLLIWFGPLDEYWPRLMRYAQEGLNCAVSVRHLVQNVVFFLDFSPCGTRHTGFGLMCSEKWSHFPEGWFVE